MKTKLMESHGHAEFLRQQGWSEESINAVDNHLDLMKVEDDLIEDPEDEDELVGYAKFENADNFRFARAGNKIEVGVYLFDYHRGCCGFCDDIIVTDTEIILVGFNYGH